MLLLAVLCTAATTLAYDFQSGDLYYNITSDNTVEVTYQEYKSTSNYQGLTTATIPATVTDNGTTYSVTSIGYSAFVGCSALTSITLPNSVTSIGDEAFRGCSALTSITLPNSVTSIGNYAFDGCSSLTSITLPNSVTSIGGFAFYACSSLTSVTLGNSVTSIGGSAFSGCSSLTSVTLGNSVTSIGGSAFSGCSSITSITIPNSVTSIGWSAFADCSFLTSITIPNSVTSIGSSAFAGCSSLTSITIPNSVTSIGERAFGGCSSLTSIVWNAKKCEGWGSLNYGPFYSTMSNITSFTFGEEVETIPSYLCYGMSSLTSITIPNSVTSIGERAFGGCSSLTKLICEGHIEDIDYAFPNCYALDTIVISAKAFDVEESKWTFMPKNIRYIQLTGGEITDNAFNVILRNYKTLGTLDLAAATNTTLSDEAFKGCYNLQTLLLPSQLTSIPYMAVADCKALQAITIPATVEEIDNSAFENCRSIQSITFEGATSPENGGASFAPAAETSALWRIGNWAFYNCHQLQHLTIPESITEIGDAAFYGCTYLEDMTLPSTMRKIGDNTFALCSKLQKIHVLALVPPTICAKTFYDVNRAIPVYVPDEAVEDYKSDTYWQEFNIIGESDAPMSIETIRSANTQGVQKLLRNGQVLILRNGETYDMMGQRL